MNTVILQGGLANKMFEYAFCFGLFKRGFHVATNESAFTPRMSHEELKINDVFKQLSLQKDERKTFLRSILWRRDRFGNYCRKFYRSLPNYKLVQESVFGYDSNIFNKLTTHCDILGLWQSEKYFMDYRKELLMEFSFMPFEDQVNIDYSKQILNSNSVSIHVRKGEDYKKFGMSNGTCPLSYYHNAICYIKQRINNPIFYIFTDNENWVYDNLLKLDANFCICKGNPVFGNNSFRDMQLMSLCKHNIIANSTYSWWGAWLNKNDEKIVIAPKVWFNSTKGFYNDLADNVPDNWVKL